MPSPLASAAISVLCGPKASVASFSLSEARFFAGAEEDPPGAAGRLLGLPN